MWSLHRVCWCTFYKVVCISMCISFLFMGSWVCLCLYLFLFINLLGFYFNFCLILSAAKNKHQNNIGTFRLIDNYSFAQILSQRSYKNLRGESVVWSATKVKVVCYYWCNRCCHCYSTSIFRLKCHTAQLWPKSDERKLVKQDFGKSNNTDYR